MPFFDPDEYTLLQAEKMLTIYVQDMQDCIVSLRHNLDELEQLCNLSDFMDKQHTLIAREELVRCADEIYVSLPQLSEQACRYKALRLRLMCAPVIPPFVRRIEEE